MDELKKPYFHFMISRNLDPKEQIPVMGFFLSDDTIIEIFIDDFLSVMDASKNKNFGYKRIATISDINERELIVGISKRDGVLRYKIGKKGINTKSEGDISEKGEIPLSEIIAAIMNFEVMANEWIDSEQ